MFHANPFQRRIAVIHASWKGVFRSESGNNQLVVLYWQGNVCSPVIDIDNGDSEIDTDSSEKEVVDVKISSDECWVKSRERGGTQRVGVPADLRRGYRPGQGNPQSRSLSGWVECTGQ